MPDAVFDMQLAAEPLCCFKAVSLAECAVFLLVTVIHLQIYTKQLAIKRTFELPALLVGYSTFLRPAKGRKLQQLLFKEHNNENSPWSLTYNLKLATRCPVVL